MCIRDRWYRSGGKDTIRIPAMPESTPCWPYKETYVQIGSSQSWKGISRAGGNCVIERYIWLDILWGGERYVQSISGAHAGKCGHCHGKRGLGAVSYTHLVFQLAKPLPIAHFGQLITRQREGLCLFPRISTCIFACYQHSCMRQDSALPAKTKRPY